MKKIVSLAAVATMAAVCALPTFAYTNSTEAVTPEDCNSNKNLPSATTGDTSIYLLVGVLFIISIIILIVKRKDRIMEQNK
mgnify:CR=1 FL=1